MDNTPDTLCDRIGTHIFYFAGGEVPVGWRCECGQLTFEGKKEGRVRDVEGTTEGRRTIPRNSPPGRPNKSHEHSSLLRPHLHLEGGIAWMILSIYRIW